MRSHTEAKEVSSRDSSTSKKKGWKEGSIGAQTVVSPPPNDPAGQNSPPESKAK